MLGFHGLVFELNFNYRLQATRRREDGACSFHPELPPRPSADSHPRGVFCLHGIGLYKTAAYFILEGAEEGGILGPFSMKISARVKNGPLISRLKQQDRN